jgi:hypothetical protein
MALYHRVGTPLTVVGYTEDAGLYKLCCRASHGVCAMYRVDELTADDGLVEIEAAFRQVLGFSPWHAGDKQTALVREMQR